MTAPASHLTDSLTRRLAIANLAAQIGIVVTGGLVRLTGSGLGCSEWPMCTPGSFTPVFHEEMTFHPFVEFGNRTLTGVLVVIAALLLWALYKRPPASTRPRILRALGWTIIALIGVQAVVGGFSVWMDLHPAIVGTHMSLSFVLIAVSAYLVVRLTSEDGSLEHPRFSWLVYLTGVAAVLMLVAGVITTGSGPHSGDAEAPYRFALDPAQVTQVHSALTYVFVALLVALILMARRNGVGVGHWKWVLALVVAQGVVGYTQYFTGLPIVLVLIHMLLASLFVAAFTIAAVRCWKRSPAVVPAH